MKNFAELARMTLPEAARTKPLEVWFQDEARVGQQGTSTRHWARRGTRPRAPKDCRYAWACIFGAVCPGRADGAALVIPHANTEAMSADLAEISRQVTPDAHALLVLDGAGWHSSRHLAVQDNIPRCRSGSPQSPSATGRRSMDNAVGMTPRVIASLDASRPLNLRRQRSGQIIDNLSVRPA